VSVDNTLYRAAVTAAAVAMVTYDALIDILLLLSTHQQLYISGYDKTLRTDAAAISPVSAVSSGIIIGLL